MAKIAYLLLCHHDPDAIVAQARRLVEGGDCVAIHFDARAPQAAFARIRAALRDVPSVAFASRRFRCGWGEWSLVAATLDAARVALAAFPDASHLYLVSGDCMPIKSAAYARRFLDGADVDHIESVDFFTSGWIRTGIRTERLIYRHWFNERDRKTLFYASMDVQRRLGLARAVPADLQIQIGSQWWCLRRATMEAVLAFCAARADVMRFFRTTWIPDETFFQTLVRHLVPGPEIRTRPLTFLMFTDYGMPVQFCNDHYDLLLSQDHLFARKISPHAEALKARLGALYADAAATFDVSDDGRALHAFMTGRGRIGRRFAPRFWETESSLGRDRTLLMVVCRKWHVAKRLVEQMRRTIGLPAVDYLFGEVDTPLPDLGGIETTLDKRNRHRRALVRMLYDHWRSDVLVLCIDPGDLEIVRDFVTDRAATRILEVECEFSDADLVGHACRIGLATPRTPRGVLDGLVATIRHDVRFESERLRDAGFADLHVIRQRAGIEQNAAALAAFLGIPEPQARALAAFPGLFDDTDAPMQRQEGPVDDGL